MPRIAPDLAALAGLHPDLHPSTGTADDDDDPGAEHAGENEVRERAVNERMEAPDEFETDDEDDLEDRRNDYIVRLWPA